MFGMEVDTRNLKFHPVCHKNTLNSFTVQGTLKTSRLILPDPFEDVKCLDQVY
jgi:hypothetical protein